MLLFKSWIPRVPASLLGMLLMASWSLPEARAQLAQTQSDDRVLFLTPIPESPDDSAFALEFADYVRSRMESRLRHKLRVVKKDVINELLVTSGFEPDRIIEPNMAPQVARALQADAYITGSVTRSSATPSGRFRMVDQRRSGLSGWMTVQGQPGDPPRAFADRFVDSLSNQVKAAEYARDCSDRRDRGDFRRARERADRAFALYPNHPSSAICISYVFQANREPAESLIWAYDKATQGDPELLRAWEELARQYIQMGDTAKAVTAFSRQLEANPDDADMRLTVASGFTAVGDHESARDVLNAGLARDPDNLKFVQLKSRACFEGELWPCALEALAKQYDLDSTLAGDEEFFPRIFGVAQTVGDTAAMLEWSGEAVERHPQSVLLWKARASALRDAGMSDSALTAYERLVDLDSADLVSALAAAQLLIGELVIDTATAVDTTQLNRAGEFLDLITSSTTDTALVMNSAVLYFRPGQQLVQSRRAHVDELAIGVDWLEKSLQYDWQGRLTRQANFFVGLGIFFLAADLDAKIVESKSCEEVAEYSALLTRGVEAMNSGASVAQQTADQILDMYKRYEARPPTFRRAFNCRGQ